MDVGGFQRQPASLLSPLAPVFEPSSPDGQHAIGPAVGEPAAAASGDASCNSSMTNISVGGAVGAGSVPLRGSLTVSESEAGRSSIGSGRPSSGATSMDATVPLSENLEARSAMAAVVGSIVEGMGVPRSRSHAALGEIKSGAAPAGLARGLTESPAMHIDLRTLSL
jgi:hypothetical protein